ncbi:hypothetical protein [Streptomyces sp. NPDC053726]|uniref:hypothetical protein n=1 Tax=Streptomyces sp. NPDC053726 TaxID=3365713 RepID=UPI0037D534FC
MRGPATGAIGADAPGDGPGEPRAQSPPVVVRTSNRTREVHDALKRRCLYHWFDHPGFDRELAIVRSRQSQVTAPRAAQVTAVVQQLCNQNLLEQPGEAETIDWAEALDALALPYVDAFVEGHSPDALERLAAVVRGAVADA